MAKQRLTSDVVPEPPPKTFSNAIPASGTIYVAGQEVSAPAHPDLLVEVEATAPAERSVAAPPHRKRARTATRMGTFLWAYPFEVAL
jgi:hypothetical protein